MSRALEGQSSVTVSLEETRMSDDKSKRDAADRERVAGGQDYEVEYLRKLLKVSADTVRTAIAKVGNSRAAVTKYIKEHVK